MVGISDAHLADSSVYLIKMQERKTERELIQVMTTGTYVLTTVSMEGQLEHLAKLS